MARIAGVDVFLDWSLLIIFALVAVSLGGGGLPAWHPDWSALTIWSVAVTAAALFLLSVLVHELSHALVGRMHGIEVPSITLFVFGGMAQMKEEPKAWRGELWMALAGPVTSLVLGVAFVALGAAAAGSVPVGTRDPERFLSALSPFATLCLWLGPVNIVLAAFNLVPGFPLDGGRVLRALIWGATGDRSRATRIAANGGRLVAWLLIGTGFAMALGVRVPLFGAGLVGGFWLALIGWFLHNAAIASVRQLALSETLSGVTAGRLMHSPVRCVPLATSVQSLVDEHLMPGEQRAFPVVEDDRVKGIVCLRDVQRLERERWPTTQVASIMTPAAQLTSVSPADPAMEALAALSRLGVNQLLVTEQGRLRGMIRREDILRWIAVYGEGRTGPRDARV